MKRYVACITLLLVLTSGRAFAGHGFMNSFADVEWLPEPGCTPDELCYVLDTLAEHIVLLIARVRGDVIDVSLATAREKLAEVSAMIKAGDAAAASRARRRYETLVALAAGTVERAPAETRTRRRERFLNALLEHVYILTVDYVDMPLGIRSEILGPLFDRAMAIFAEVREQLPEAVRKAMFFREEEIRWSLEMTAQADAQKITNEFAGE